MRKLKTRKIEIPNEQKKLAIEEIICYFEHERKETIGNIEGLMLFTFIMEKIGPYIYNLAVMDSQKYIHDRVEDLYELIYTDWDLD